jgi:uncharacterized repeat protein (TIGR01451 family)
MAALSTSPRLRPDAPHIEPLETRITPGSVAFPSVVSILAVGSAHTEGSSVAWKITFSQNVTGVDSSDFSLSLGGGLSAPGLFTVTPVSGKVYTVKTTGLSGDGTVALNLFDDGSIRDAAGHPLKADSFQLGGAQTVSFASYLSSVTTVDLDGDGHLDIVSTDYYSSGLLVSLGNGDGTFQAATSYTTGYSPNSVTAADFDGDGKLDLAVAANDSDFTTSAFTSVSVLLGNGDGTFQSKHSFGTGYGALAVANGDLNGDGKLDLVVTANMSGFVTVGVLLGNGDGTFQAQRTFTPGANPQGLALGDVNKDGKLDVVTANTDDNTISVLLGKGDGDLKPKTDFTTGDGPVSVALADLNGDGKLDAATANTDGGTASVLLGNGNGTFKTKIDFATGPQSGGVSVADFDGDGRLDLAVTHGSGIVPKSVRIEGGSSTAVAILLGDGKGSFQPKQDFSNGTYAIRGLSLGDFDGNGRIDIATAGGDSGVAKTLLNVVEQSFAGPSFTVGVARTDLAITSFTDGVTEAHPGDFLNYVIGFANHSTKTATGVKLSVALPNDTTFLAKENPGWKLEGGFLVKTVSKLGGDATGTAKLKLHANKTISAFQSGIYATATISDDGTSGEDTNSENNGGFDYDNFAGYATDLAITSVEDGGLAYAGETTTYVVHYANTGSRGSNASVTVTLPTSTSFNAAASDGAWADNGNGTFTLGNLDAPVGSSSTATFAVDVAPGADQRTPLSLTASVQSNYYTDTNPANDSLIEQTPFYSGIYVTAPGVAAGKKFAPPLIQVFDRATGLEIRSFLAYEPEYRDSIRVAVGDFNNDGIDDIATTTQGGTGRLRVFDGKTGEQFDGGPFAEEIAVFNGTTEKGAFVAAGDVNGDGYQDIVIGSALGGGKVKVYSGRPVPSNTDDISSLPAEVIKEYTPFGAKFKGGVRVAVGDVNGYHYDSPSAALLKASSMDDIVVGQGYSGGRVIVYDGATDTVLQDFSVGGKGYKGGVSVAAGDMDGDGLADIVVGRNSGKPGVVEVFSGLTHEAIGQAFNPFDASPLAPKNIYGVRVAVVDVNLDGVADIITSVGVKSGSQVKIYDGRMNKDGTYHILEDRTITAYADYLDVALWVAGSRTSRLV